MIAGDLVGYQDPRYAGRLLDLVERTIPCGDAAFSETVARMHHRLLAYKDEYEVARLMRSPDGLAEALALTGGDASSIGWHLRPPALRAFGRKFRFGARSAPLFAVLARGKRLRGGRLDPFGRTDLRRLERSMPGEYEDAIGRVIAAVHAGRIGLDRAREIAALPDSVRGFEDLKARRAAAYRAVLATALAEEVDPAVSGRGRDTV